MTSDQNRRLTEIRATLQSQTAAIKASYETERDRLRSQLSANALVRNREYAFALYPEVQLRQFLLPLANRD